MRVLRVHVLPRLITLWLISVVTFVATHALGVDVARRTLGKEVTASQLSAFRHQYGLDKPLLTQYVTWLSHFVRGDWGISPVSGQPIRHGVVERLDSTLLLSAGALLVALPISIALGMFMAKRAGRLSDLSLSIGSVGLAATPVFVIGILLIYVFSVQLGWTPVDSTALSFGGTAAHVRAYILPIATLALALIPHVTRITRASVWDTLTAPYAQAAVLRGLTRPTVTWRYLMPNASAPVINAVALDMMWLVGGVILVENVFGFPGLGTLLVASVEAGDVISVQTIVLLTGALFIAISLAADLLVVAFNPRLRAA